MNTAEDFWRMVWENGTCSIAMLAPLEDIDEVEQQSEIKFFTELQVSVITNIFLRKEYLKFGGGGSM